jgi:sec-independent protein translocase protein TatC
MKTYFLKHLKDLKFHFLLFFSLLILTFTISYIFSDQWIYLLIKPLIYLKKSNYFIFTDIIEIFYIKILLSIILSLFISIFCGFFQFWFFLAPGLYKKENFLILKIIIVFLILFFISLNFIFIYIIPNAWKFFIEFEKTTHPFLFNIYLEPRLYNYLLFIIKILFYTNILFQYPFLILLLLLFKIISIQQIIKFRKFFYIKVLIMSSLIAPPDIWSQIIIFTCLIILIELFIFIFFLIKKD